MHSFGNNPPFPTSPPLSPLSPSSPRFYTFSPPLSPTRLSAPPSPKSPRVHSFPLSYSLQTDSEGYTSLRRALLTRDVIDPITVPKNRRPRFELILQIHDLNNVPLTTGHAYVKWHISGSAKRENHGVTERAPVKDHKVFWNHTNTCGVRMTIDRTGTLQETNLVFQVVQEFAGDNGSKEERAVLGIVSLNLAEYAGVEKETRRYLMQESKINSTLKVTVALTQISGDTTFKVLKTAHIFGAITGVINDQGPNEGSVGSGQDTTSSQMTLEHLHYTASLSEMYRETLTSQWTTHTDELDADACIDDIFSGGSGWKTSPRSPPSNDSNSAKPSKHKHRKSSSRSGLDGDLASPRSATHPSSTDPSDRSDSASTTSSTSDRSHHSHHSTSSHSQKSNLSLRIAAQSTRSSSSASNRIPRSHFDDNGVFGRMGMGMGGNGVGQAGRWREMRVERRGIARTGSAVAVSGRRGEVDESEVREDLRSWQAPR